MPLVRRLGSSSGAAIAGVGAGLGALAFIFLAQQRLGSARLAPLTQLWAWWAISFAVVAIPLQQSAVRLDRDGRPRASVLLRPAAGALIIGATIIMSWGPATVFRSDDGRWVAMAAAVTVLATMSGTQRGLAAGDGRQRRLRFYLAGENGLRALLAGLAGGFGLEAEWFGLALLGGYAIYIPGAGRAIQRLWEAPVTRAATDRFGGSLSLSAGSYGLLVLAPALIALGPASSLLVGQLFFVLAVSRAPFQLAQSVLPAVTADAPAQQRVRRLGPPATIAAAFIVAAASASVGLLIVEVVLSEPVVLGRGTLAAAAVLPVLAGSNLVLAAITVVGDPPEGRAGGHLLWAVAVGTGIGLAVLMPTPGLVLGGLILVELAMLFWLTRRMRHRGSGSSESGELGHPAIDGLPLGRPEARSQR